MNIIFGTILIMIGLRCLGVTLSLLLNTFDMTCEAIENTINDEPSSFIQFGANGKDVPLGKRHALLFIGITCVAAAMTYGIVWLGISVF